MPRIVGYTYNADVYCIRCARATHGYAGCAHHSPAPVTPGLRACELDPMLDDNGIPAGTRDSEGNLVFAILSTDEAPDYEEVCWDCGSTVRDGRLCSGCDRAHRDCTCYDDDDGDELDEYTEAAGCQCVDCMAASEYTGEVA